MVQIDFIFIFSKTFFQQHTFVKDILNEHYNKCEKESKMIDECCNCCYFGFIYLFEIASSFSLIMLVKVVSSAFLYRGISKISHEYICR